MALAVKEQIQELISKSRHILITFRPDGGGDAIGAALAMYLYCKKQGAQADIASDEIHVPAPLNFLPSQRDIKKELPPLQKYIIKIDVEHTPLETLSYDVKDHTLSIFITPKRGAISRDQITTAASEFKYDLIIAVDTADLNSLGSIYANNTDLFFKTPLINVDHHPSNEHYGQINVVDLSASSTSELVARLLNELQASMIDKDIATALLTGMIVNTKSFKTSTVTPATLTTASQLMKLGADRDAIVERVYRSKSIATFKLWGAALSKLQSDPALGFVWLTLSADEFVRSETAPDHLPEIIDEILMNAQDARVILVLYQSPADMTAYHGLLRTTGAYDARRIAFEFSPRGSARFAQFTVPADMLLNAVQMIKEHLAQFAKM